MDCPRLLFFSFAFPPSRAIGAVRCWNLAKHLARIGWEVTVVTPNPALLSNPEPGTEIESRCSREGIRRILTDHRLRFLLGGWLKLRPWERSPLIRVPLRALFRWRGVDIGRGWIRPALEACRSLKPGDIDLVLVSGSPFAAFSLAEEMAGRLRVPYVLDYRDPWTKPAPAGAPPKAPDVELERKILRGAAGSFCVAPTLAEGLEDGFRPPKKPAVITNGFDPEEVERVAPAEYGDFAVVYAGSFYKNVREIDPVLRAVRRVNETYPGSRPVRLHYYGKSGDYVRDKARAESADSHVVIHGQVSRAEALAAQKGAGAVAVITSVFEEGSPLERGIVTGKLYEALGLGSRVLLVAPRRSDARTIVEEVGAGRSFTGGEVPLMIEWLAELRNSNGNGHGYSGSADRYSWPMIAKKADAYLRECLADARRDGSASARMDRR